MANANPVAIPFFVFFDCPNITTLQSCGVHNLNGIDIELISGQSLFCMGDSFFSIVLSSLIFILLIVLISYLGMVMVR